MGDDGHAHENAARNEGKGWKTPGSGNAAQQDRNPVKTRKRQEAIAGAIVAAAVVAIAAGAVLIPWYGGAGKDEAAGGKESNITLFKDGTTAGEFLPPSEGESESDEQEEETTADAPPAAEERPVRPMALAYSGVDSSGACDVFDWEDVKKVVAGQQSTFGLKSDGTVLTSQNTRSRELFGHLDVQSWKGIEDIDGNSDLLVGLRKDGTVLAADNEQRAWAKGRMAGWDDIVAVAASEYVVGIRSDRTAVIAGERDDVTAMPKAKMEDGSYVTVPVPDLSGWHDVQAIDTSQRYVAGLLKDGTVVISDGMSGDTTVDRMHGATQIACHSQSLAALMPDGTVLDIGMDNPRSAPQSIAGWEGITSINGGDELVGIGPDGSVLSTNPKLPMDGWHGVTQASASLYSIVALCSDTDMVETMKAVREAEKADWERFLRESDATSEDRAWYDTTYRQDDGRWKGWWYVLTLPEGYEVSPAIKSRGGDLALPSDPNRLVPVGSEDDMTFGEYRYDIPVIELGMNVREAVTAERGETEEPPYVAASGREYRVFRTQTKGGRPQVRYAVTSGEFSAAVTGTDVDDVVMRKFIDDLEILDDRLRTYAPVA